MIPSVLTSQIRRGVEDFLQTTFPPSNRFFHGLLEELFDCCGREQDYTRVRRELAIENK